jgi:hypothetical protein
MSGLRRISSSGARLASNPTVPQLHHRHRKIGPQHLVLNPQAMFMRLPRITLIRRIPLLPDRTTIRLTKRTRRRISCPRDKAALGGLFWNFCDGRLGQSPNTSLGFSSGREGNSTLVLCYSTAKDMGKTALMIVPGLPAATSNWPPNCKTRSRIPAMPTPSFLFFVGSSGVASEGIPLP